MVNKGFPKFGMSQAGAFVAALKNYNLPDFILVLVAKECKSELLERGRIDDRLSSLNDDALELLHKVFIDCDDYYNIDVKKVVSFIKENTYFKEGDQQYEGLFYKIDKKEYKVFLTYCKPVEKEK